MLPERWVNVAVAECAPGDGVPGCVAGEPGQCLWVCRDALPGCRINVLGLPGCVASVPVESAVTCCRCAGLMQEQLGTRGNPHFRAAGPGRAHSQCYEPKVFSLLSTL